MRSTGDFLPDVELISLYPGTKEMIVVDSQDPRFIAKVVCAMVPEPPSPNQTERR